MPDKPAAPVRPASTVLLLRDGDGGLEVFMVERHHEIDFSSGALVFPGGKVDPGDADPSLRDLTDGAEDLDDPALAFRIGAIREAFEEAGVLLGRADGALVEGTAVETLGARYRKPLEADEVGMAEMAAREGLRYACDLLVPFAHWVTPDLVPKRFDTWFFLAPATEDHVTTAEHDGREAVDSVWIRPLDAVAEAEAGRRTVIFPTLMNLKKLARSETVGQALATARAAPIVTVMPELVPSRDGSRTLRIPAEADYGLTEFTIPGR